MRDCCHQRAQGKNGSNHVGGANHRLIAIVVVVKLVVVVAVVLVVVVVVAVIVVYDVSGANQYHGDDQSYVYDGNDGI